MKLIAHFDITFSKRRVPADAALVFPAVAPTATLPPGMSVNKRNGLKN